MKSGAGASRERTGTARRGRSGTKSRRAALKHQTWRSGQMSPTPDRYQAIQQALVEKGYANGTPDGVWGPQWVDALKRFQQDQKLEPNGKLTSLSLITLGLGPRRQASLSVPASASTIGSLTHTREQQ